MSDEPASPLLVWFLLGVCLGAIFMAVVLFLT